MALTQIEEPEERESPKIITENPPVNRKTPGFPSNDPPSPPPPGEVRFIDPGDVTRESPNKPKIDPDKKDRSEPPQKISNTVWWILLAIVLGAIWYFN